jgi:hypothetical protein
MRTPRPSCLLGVVVVAFAACSEGSGDKAGAPDATSLPASDASAVPDAPDDDGADARADARIELGTDGGVLGGFGQRCSQRVACPVDAPICVVPVAGGVEGVCSIVCADDFAFITDGQGSITTRPDASADRRCAMAYTGVGTSTCQSFLGNTFRPPVVGQPQPNREYTGDVACAIRCGLGNACPLGLRCDLQFQVCAP